MSTISSPKWERIQSALAGRSIMTTAELQVLGVSREYVRQLVIAGRLEKVARGLFRLPDADFGLDFSIAEAARIVPNGVVCLLSALRLHRVTTQSPFDVWMAVEAGQWVSRQSVLPIRFVRPGGSSFQEGIERHIIEGVDVRVYSLAKTVADCFKYRSKVGLAVALEALRESQREKRASVDDVWHYARVCRVANVMRPYLEAID